MAIELGFKVPIPHLNTPTAMGEFMTGFRRAGKCHRYRMKCKTEEPAST